MPTRNAAARSVNTEPTRLLGPIAPPPIERLLRIASVMDVTSLSKASIYRKVADHSFPAPLKIGKSRVAWKQSAISEWMAKQPPST
jgi:prophage regulatory protein